MTRLTKSFGQYKSVSSKEVESPADQRMKKMEEMVNENWRLLAECANLTTEDQKQYLQRVEQKINQSQQIIQAFKS